MNNFLGPNSEHQKKKFKKVSDIKNETTFERSSHDEKHFYVKLSTKLLRNKEMSPNARWLISYLLCNDDEKWTITFKQVYNHVKDHIGKNKLYEIINECIDHGYLKREEFLDEHNLQKTKYFISEDGNFKKCLRRPGFREAENRDPENREHNKNKESFQDSNKNQEYNNTSKGVDNLPREKKKSYEQKPSAIASDIATYLFQEIQKRMPKFKSPNMKEWATAIDRMLRIDKRESFEIMEVITWLKNDDWYSANILSPNSLRKKFDEIQSKMIFKDKKMLISQNREYALAMKKKYPTELKGMSFDEKCARNVFDTDIGIEAPFALPHNTFKIIFIKMFGANLNEAG